MLMVGEHPKKGLPGMQHGNGFCHRIQGPGCHFEAISSQQSPWWEQMVRRRPFLACQQLGSLHSGCVAALVHVMDRTLNVVTVSSSAPSALKMLLVLQNNLRMHRFGYNFPVPLNMSSTPPACNHGSVKLLCVQSAEPTLGRY